MTGQSDNAGALSDYSAFLKALLPSARGFLCNDRAGKLFWSEMPTEGWPVLPDAFRAALSDTLLGKTLDPDRARIPLGTHVAYMIPLAGDNGRLLGALTVLVDNGAGSLGYAAVEAALKPALRSLQRELLLRFRLLDGQRKLQVQAAEERLLHQVEGLLRDGQDCRSALQRILELCHEHLGVEAAMVVIPGKRITAAFGGMSAEEAQLLAGELLEAAAARDFAAAEIHESGPVLWLPLFQRSKEVQGIFGLSGWNGSGFSPRRIARVAHYIGSHIDSLLDREFDSLTGLMTWPVFERELVAAGSDIAGGDSYAVLCIDLDQLHVLNDTFGRAVGDEVLQRLANLLREVLPEQPVCRVTGDNFAALLPNTTLNEARAISESVCLRLRENAWVRGDQTYRATVSIGIGPLSTSEDEGGGMAYARIACKAAKDRGRARVEVYEPTDVSIIRRADDIQLVGYVRNAIENGRLALMGQSLMPLKEGGVPHYLEVLVRIVNDAGEQVSPAEFISAAERYHLMEDLDRWVVANSLKLIAAGGVSSRATPARFAINLSGQSLGSDAFLPFVESTIATSGVAPELITFEITESVAVARMRQAQEFMHTLKKIGCRFSLDDFGIGLSSFSYLKLFPVDTLKIDGSFIRDITTNVVSQSVVAAIAEVARVMKLDTVAEYVQDQAAVDLLRTLNIGYAQGYVFGAAEPLAQQIEAITLKSAPVENRQVAPAAV